ncbi:MAG: sigma-54 dependent transcriptional regulator [Polyangiales bacterium]
MIEEHRMGERKQVLIADDEANLRRIVSAQLERDGYDVFTAADGQEAVESLAQNHIDLLITDLKMPRLDGMGLLKSVMGSHPHLPVIMITAHGTVDTAVEALKLGAFDYVTKPFDRTELRTVVNKAIRTRELSQSVAPAADGNGRFGLIGTSPSMKEVFAFIDRVANTPSGVLITGESGTGKELVASALHEHSSRKGAPFIRVNCAAIPPDLIESELFGYERGAFTGAVTSKPGRFELADGGTLFLDEIGEIPLAMQPKLLRAIQEQEFERVGGIKTIRVDVRLLAATNRDLETEIEEGRFREDLYYRLRVLDVHLPPLRDRVSDIPMLIEHFLQKFNRRFKKSVVGLSDDARALFLANPWRGNIRELENTLERCMIFADDDTIELQHCSPEIRQLTLVRESSTSTPSIDDIQPPVGTIPTQGLKHAVREVTEKVEREFISRALAQTDGNVTHTARLLKISRKSLQNKMKELGLRDDS